MMRARSAQLGRFVLILPLNAAHAQIVPHWSVGLSIAKDLSNYLSPTAVI